jgi:hypothetical protein
MAFTTQALANANTLKKQLDAINAAQAGNALAGSSAKIIIVDDKGNTIVTAQDLATALGAGYATQCSTALSALNTALGNAETTAQAAFDAIA